MPETILTSELIGYHTSCFLREASSSIERLSNPPVHLLINTYLPTYRQAPHLQRRKASSRLDAGKMPALILSRYTTAVAAEVVIAGVIVQD